MYIIFCKKLTTAFLESAEGSDCRKYFMINLYERMLSDPAGEGGGRRGVEPATFCSPVGCASDCWRMLLDPARIGQATSSPAYGLKIIWPDLGFKHVMIGSKCGTLITIPARPFVPYRPDRNSESNDLGPRDPKSRWPRWRFRLPITLMPQGNTFLSALRKVFTY